MSVTNLLELELKQNIDFDILVLCRQGLSPYFFSAQVYEAFQN